MLNELFPRDHARYRSLPVLGQYLDGFIGWLRIQGYPSLPIRLRVRAAKTLDALLQAAGVSCPSELTAIELLRYGPKKSWDDVYLSAIVRSLARYFDEQDILAPPTNTPTRLLIARYRRHLESVRGLAAKTIQNHIATVTELLTSVGYDDTPDRLADLSHNDIERFIQALAKRLCRASLQHHVAHLRSFLRFLATCEIIPTGLDEQIDTARVYRDEHIPRSLPWRTVRALLESIDRSTTMGRRDYAMFLLVATYGLRACEVVTLTLDDIEWCADRLLLRQSKVNTPLMLPLTPGVGAAIIDYLRNGRPELPCREVFLRVRAPAGTLKPTALTEAFQGCVRRSGLPISFQGPHCIRHSLAVHLLRNGASLKAIGDLLGHRSAESTCMYLRLQIEDLRDVALPLPTADAAQVLR